MNADIAPLKWPLLSVFFTWLLLLLLLLFYSYCSLLGKQIKQVKEKQIK